MAKKLTKPFINGRFSHVQPFDHLAHSGGILTQSVSENVGKNGQTVMAHRHPPWSTVQLNSPWTLGLSALNSSRKNWSFVFPAVRPFRVCTSKVYSGSGTGSGFPADLLDGLGQLLRDPLPLGWTAGPLGLWLALQRVYTLGR
jgi:hypothetical protein